MIILNKLYVFYPRALIYIEQVVCFLSQSFDLYERVVCFLSPSLDDGIENTQPVQYKSYQIKNHGRSYIYSA
jgi:hypothetical protein